jgi:threonine dehydratase
LTRDIAPDFAQLRAAVPVAALLDNPQALAGKRVGVIVSGGNLDLDRLPWYRMRGDGAGERGA